MMMSSCTREKGQKVNILKWQKQQMRQNIQPFVSLIPRLRGEPGNEASLSVGAMTGCIMHFVCPQTYMNTVTRSCSVNIVTDIN